MAHNLNQRILSLKEEITRKQDELEELTQQQLRCHHAWNAAVFDQLLTQEEYTTEELEKHGSDVWPKTAWREKLIPAWSRTCALCGMKETTQKMKVVKEEPDFT